MARRYDSRTTIFSPEGRLYQVEYAMEAISNAGSCVGILAKDGVVLAAEKRITSKLLDSQAVGVRREKMYRLDDHIACAVAGITADANILVNSCRLAAQRYLFTYQEPMPVDQLVRQLCDTKQGYTQYGGLRPFGVSLLYAGWDKQRSFQLYQSDPSGNYGGWKATAIGANHQAATNVLQGDFKDDLSLEEAIKLVVKVLSKTMDSTTLSPEKVELATLSRDEDAGQVVYRVYEPSELKPVLEAVNAEMTKEKEKEKKQRLDVERRRLPAWSARDKLVELVKGNQVLVIIGETGSGKTTQIPRFLYDAGLAQGGAIACTQPRRVAAVTVAQRVADEMGTELGGKVGYSIRFDDKTSPQTRIKYLTDGMLLREALVDPTLKRYKVVVLDEAHERTVATDVLFGLLKGVCAARPDDFRLVVMSATLDAAAFTRYFGGAQAAYIQGRQFPVQVMYTSAPEDSYVDAAITAALQVHCDEGPGDILVFLTGQEEIEACERLISERGAALPPDPERPELLVLPIYAALPPEQQLRVFAPAPPNTRKIILSTNIAETSITISGVRYVIDTGFVKSRSYSPRLGADCLQVTPISQAQARQRSGRAGREAPGKAFRLYTEASFQQLPPSTLPEIQRTNLASVVLQLKALGIQDVLGFDFMDPPPRAALLRSLELLLALGALDSRGDLTKPTGERLARLPVEPMYGKVLLASGEMGCAQEALAVVAMVSTDVVFHLPRGKREEAAEAHARFHSREGDHLTLLSVFRAYNDVSKKGLERASWCRAHFINPRAMRKAVDIHAQLKEHLVALGIALQSCGEDSLPLRRALVAGLFPHAAKRQMDGSYKVIATGQAVAIHPSSVLCGKKAECIVFNELVRTSKQYARDAVAIEAAWLPELAPAYFARQHANAGR